MRFPANTPVGVQRIIESLFDAEDVGAFWISEDLKRLTVNVYIDGGTSAQTFVLNDTTGNYELVAYNGLRRAKADGG